MSDKKTLFVVSDVHGHYTLLKDALEKSGFDSKNDSHILICCGDYFDRGDENVEVFNFFKEIKNKVLIRGNHEDSLLKVLQTGKMEDHNYINGTIRTIEDFFDGYYINPLNDRIDFFDTTGTVKKLSDFIMGTLNYFETKNYVFVHGWLVDRGDTTEGRKNATDEQWEKARWERWTDRYFDERPLDDKTLICGHMPTFFAKQLGYDCGEDFSGIFYGNGLIAIDAGTYNTQKVNVLVIEDELNFN
ncbi:MAG: metallophosphoesterase [Clostridia bacterium]|nr:metallophosphoesterase [Clostridia bacterium]